MEAVAAVGLAAAAVQFTQLCLGIIASLHANRPSLDGNSSATVELEQTKTLIDNMQILKSFHSIVGPNVDAGLTSMCSSAIAAGEQLAKLLDKCACGGKGVRRNLTAAFHSFRVQPEAKQLRERLTQLRSDISLCCQLNLERQLSRIESSQGQSLTRVESELAALRGEVKLLADRDSRYPKELGFPWETGTPNDHVLIDCGLGNPFFLPIWLCSTRQAFHDILRIKFCGHGHSKLPGHELISKGHFLCHDWNETQIIDDSTWSANFRTGGRAKVSFIMTTLAGFDRNKCFRCKKPAVRQSRPAGMMHCTSCKLTLHKEPCEARWTDTKDTVLGIGNNVWRDHQVTSVKTKQADEPQAESAAGVSDAPTGRPHWMDEVDLQTGNKLPSVDLVCHRLSVFWEPIFDITYRYLGCHCICRHNSPSRLDPDAEVTFFIPAMCPRHNIKGFTFKDYGYRDYQSDGYFIKHYGSYDIFRAIIFWFYPSAWRKLGGKDFLQPDHAMFVLPSERLGEPGILDKYIKYTHVEVTEFMRMNPGASLSPDKDVEKDLKYIAELYEAKNPPRGLFSGQARTASESSSFKAPGRTFPGLDEVVEICDERWDGVPHWDKWREESSSSASSKTG